ncbi:MAG: T9SS type A sorting domain-containing protein [candidate division Zixibacteria bacterium]|nr:T9SS type A sorting domain-containing protein [candidate division Zixibacteria bacterium]
MCFRICLAVFVLLITCNLSIADTPIDLSPSNLEVSFNGTFIYNSVNPHARVCSNNGFYYCTYKVTDAGDELRTLSDFRFYKDSQLLFTMANAPGSDLYISNSGYIVFFDMSRHFDGFLTIHYYKPSGEKLFSREYQSASLFGFSPNGDKFGVGHKKGLEVISLPDGDDELFSHADKFAISEDNRWLATARDGIITIHKDNIRRFSIDAGSIYSRGLEISTSSNFVAVIDKHNLKTYSLTSGDLIAHDRLEDNYSYRELAIHNGNILAGVHYRVDGISKGYLRIYQPTGKVLCNNEEAVRNYKTFSQKVNLKKDIADYDPIPWPFEPFDTMHTVWNHYEQHMSYGEADWSYLHQGLDIITPIAEPTYAVTPGVVKCVLTLGGESYWRLAVSQEQVSERSNGWLYAHLIRSSIQVDAGDTVDVHDYLGDIIEWYDDWGHIHFVEINDTGLIWRYDDNEWGINFNPLLALTGDPDTIAPEFENVFHGSLFGFCENERSDYQYPDELQGDIDIIVKVSDYIGDSDWEQPAYELYYQIKRIEDGEIILPRTLAQILNHPYSFYGTEQFVPYATVLYKRDSYLLPPEWMELDRDYYHILTNNNGDSTVSLYEKNLAFSTDDYRDGNYRIIVEACDPYGNCRTDSMDVYFDNGIVDVPDENHNIPRAFSLKQNYPNPFNSSTELIYTLDETSVATIDIYNIMGERIESLINKSQEAGQYSIVWNAGDYSSGIYFCKLTAGNKSSEIRMTLLK